MQVWTEQMHRKTMSMHLITIFTLIFLPGTFVAVSSLRSWAEQEFQCLNSSLIALQTVFGSGILTFGEDGGGGFGPELGDWKVRVSGLKLFFIICIPLLTVTLSAWLLSYCIRLRRSRTGPFPGRAVQILAKDEKSMV